MIRDAGILGILTAGLNAHSKPQPFIHLFSVALLDFLYECAKVSFGMRYMSSRIVFFFPLFIVKSPETEMEFSGEVKLKRVVCHTDSCGLQESHMRSHLERQRPSGQGGSGLRQGQLRGAPTATQSKRALCL